jgi:hydrogenase-4 component E
METISYINLLLIILINLLFLATSRMATCIRLVALQGTLISIIPFLFHEKHLEISGLIFIGLTVFIKGIVFPWLLKRAQREAFVRHDIESFISFPVSLFIGVLLFLLAFWMGNKLPAPVPELTPFTLSVFFFTILNGFFIIISRLKAITQVMGYLILENGIYGFGFVLLGEQPVMVELGILLDIFVTVFIMGITILHINRTFDHIDTDKLTDLKDWEAPLQKEN